MKYKPILCGIDPPSLLVFHDDAREMIQLLNAAEIDFIPHWEDHRLVRLVCLNKSREELNDLLECQGSPDDEMLEVTCAVAAAAHCFDSQRHFHAAARDAGRILSLLATD